MFYILGMAQNKQTIIKQGSNNMKTIKPILYIINIIISLIGLIASIILIEKLPLMVFILVPIISTLFYYNIKSTK